MEKIVMLGWGFFALVMLVLLGAIIVGNMNEATSYMGKPESGNYSLVRADDVVEVPLPGINMINPAWPQTVWENDSCYLYSIDAPGWITRDHYSVIVSKTTTGAVHDDHGRDWTVVGGVIYGASKTNSKFNPNFTGA